MTSTPRPAARLRAGLPILITVLAAACAQSAPSPSASTAIAAPSPTAAATTAPSATAGAPATPAPTVAPMDVCADAAIPAPSGDAPTPEPGGSDDNDPNAARYAAIEQQVTAMRGLTLDKPVQRSTFDRAGLGEFIESSFNRQNPESLVLGTEHLLKGLLLMPQDQSLRDLYIEMLTSQVAGLYDDETRRMYVVTETGEIGPSEEITYAHEYTHALQDQAFDLSKVKGTATDQGDRALARTTLIEGDATLLMSLWAQQQLTPAQLAEVAGSSDPASEAVLNALPPILREPLLFPYTQGLQLTLGQFMAGGSFAGVDALFADPPDSTEQVLHPEKLNPREDPVAVTFPDDLATRLGDGWCLGLQDTLGELQLRILLASAAGVDAATAEAAAAGWGGDRVALFGGPAGTNGIVLDTRWDTDGDAGEFAAAMGGLVANLEAAGRSAQLLTPEPNRVVLVTADTADTMGRIANVLGLAG
jgi:hypothetical protein